MKTALAENPFVQNPGERGDYRGARGNGSIGNETIEPLDKGPIDPLNYSQSNSGGSLEPLAIEPKDKETWETLKGIIAKCKKNFEENKEKWEEMAFDPEARFPTEEKLPNGNIWLIDPQTGEKWGLLYTDPRDGLEYVKHIKWEGKDLTPRERQTYLR